MDHSAVGGGLFEQQLAAPEIISKPRPTTASMVMSQHYQSLGGAQRRGASNNTVQLTNEDAQRRDQRFSQQWSFNRSSLLVGQMQQQQLQNNSGLHRQQQPQPYQWPQVNQTQQPQQQQQYNSRRHLDFSNPNIFQQRQQQLRTGSSGQLSTNTTHYQQQQQQQHLMLSARKLEENQGTNLMSSPLGVKTSEITNTADATRRQTNMSTTTGNNHSRRVPSSAVRVDHTSPLRSTSKNINDAQRTQLRTNNDSRGGGGSREKVSGSGVENIFKSGSGSGLGPSNNHQMKITSQQQSAAHTMPGSNFATIISGQNNAHSLNENAHNLRTPPPNNINVFAVDDVDGEGETSAQQLKNIDFEGRVLKMHSKMKNLESRYLDLANFYKRELLAKGVTMNQSILLNNSRLSSLNQVPLGQPLKGSLNDDLSPYLQEAIGVANQKSSGETKLSPGKTDSLSQQPFDQTIEKALINDLLKEKGELERELQDMMIARQPINNESTINQVEMGSALGSGRQQHQYTATTTGAGQGFESERERASIENLKNAFADLLDKFQEDFLEFINQNYQSFTESDVMKMFQNLRSQINDLLQGIILLTSDHQPLLLGLNIHGQSELRSYQSELQEGLRQALAEYELNSGYTTQAIKKSAFELQSKHGTIQLDSKKSQIALQAIHRKCSQLQDALNSNNGYLNSGAHERSPPPHHQNLMQSSQHRGGSLLRSSINQAPMSPGGPGLSNQSSSTNARLLSEIQSQVQILSQALFSIDDKLIACDEDLKYLMNDVEDEYGGQTDKFKVALDQLLTELSANHLMKGGSLGGLFPQTSLAPDNSFLDPMMSAAAAAQQQNFNQQLQGMNAQLQGELDIAYQEIAALKERNLQLMSLAPQVTPSPLLLNSRGISFGAAENDSLQSRITSLQQENAYLQQRVRSLNRTIDEKSHQAERLTNDLHSQSAIERSRERSKERVSLEQIQFYQRKYDEQLMQTKQLVKLTYRFLQTMKKLQKAVHRKEPNVSNEKQEFEEARKQLEIRLKEIKKEVDVLVKPQMDHHIATQYYRTTYDQNVQSNNFSEGAQTLHGGINAQIHRYQNKAPQTLTGRNNHFNQSAASQVHTSIEIKRQMVAAPGGQQLNTYQSGNDEIEGSGGLSQGRSNSSHTQAQGNFDVQRQSRNSVQMFRSIEPPQSSSSGAGGLDRRSSNQKQNSASGQKPQRHAALKIEELQRKLDDVTNERDQIEAKLSQSEALCVSLQRQTEKDRLNQEHMMREIKQFAQEKNSLEMDIAQLSQMESSQSTTLKQQIERHLEKISQLERGNTEMKHQFEGYQKQIDQLKEKVTTRDAEIAGLRKEQSLVAQNQDQIRNQLMDKIQIVNQVQEFKCQEIEMILQSQEQQLSKLRRQLERKLKENDQKAVKQNEQQMVTLRQRYAEMEASKAQLEEELKRSKQEVAILRDQHTKEVQLLQEQLESEQEIFETQLEEQASQFNQQMEHLKQQNEVSIKNIKQDHQKSFDALRSQFEQQLEQEKTQINSAKDDYWSQQISEQMAALESQFNNQISKIETTWQTKMQQVLDSHRIQMQERDEEKKNGLKEREKLQKHVEWLQQEISKYLANIQSLNTQAETVSKDKEGALQRSQLQVQQLISQNKELQDAVSEAELAINNYESQHSEEISQLQAIITQTKGEAVQALQDLQHKYDKLNREHDKLNAQLNKHLKDHEAQFRAKQEECDGLSKRLQRVMTEKEGSLNATQVEILRMQELIAKQKSKLTQQSGLISELEGIKVEYEGQIEELQVANQELYEQNQQVIGENQGLNDEVKRQVSVVAELELKADHFKVQAEQIGASLQQQMRTQEDAFQERLEKAKTDYASLQAQLAEKERSHLGQVSALEADRDTICSERDRMQGQVDQMRQQNQSLIDSQNALIEERTSQVRAALQAQLDVLEEVVHARDLKIATLEGQLTSLLQDNEASNRSIIAERDQFRLQAEEQIRRLEENLRDVESRLDHQVQEYQDLLRTSQNEGQQAAQHVDALKEQLATVKGEKASLQSQVGDAKSRVEKLLETITEKDALIEELQSQIETMGQELATALDAGKSQKVKGDEKEEINQQIEDLRAQLAEAQTVSGDLGTQLSEMQLRVAQLEKELRESKESEEEAGQRLQQAVEAFEQQELEMQAVEEKNIEYQQVLTQNRTLIKMLKTEYEKSIEKEKVLTRQNKHHEEKQRSLSTQIDSLNNVISGLNSQISTLREEIVAGQLKLAAEGSSAQEQNQALAEQVLKLKQEYEERLLSYQQQQQLLPQIQEDATYIKNLEEEIKAKDELIEEANKYIEEFNDEKHEIKARFKHLMHLLADPDVLPEDESSYRGEEDEIDLAQCFEVFEQEAIKNKKKVEIKIQAIIDESKRVKEELGDREDELKLTVTQMAQVNEQIVELKDHMEVNDAEMRRQMENAAKKIAKYKARLQEKNQKVQVLIAQKANAQAHNEEAEQLTKENLVLLQRLQKAENELQMHRQQSLAKAAQDNSRIEELNNSLRIDGQRLQELEEQLVSLRRQLFQAKDQVVDTLSEQFSKRLRDLQKTYSNEQVLKAKLSEIKDSGNFEVTLNNNIKAVKIVTFFKKRFIIAQAMSNLEFYVIDQAKLSETAMTYLGIFMPQQQQLSSERGLELTQRQEKELEKLDQQLKDIREERQELNQEILIHKNKINAAANSNQDEQPQYNDLRGAELEEEVQHLTAENLEIRLKLKDLAELNQVLKMRNLELQALESYDEDSLQRQIERLQEENEMLRKYSARSRVAPPLGEIEAGDPFEDGENSFIEGIQVAENLNTSLPLDQHNNQHNLFDQSSVLMNVQMMDDLVGGVAGGGATTTHNQSQAAVEKLQKENEELKQRLQLSSQNNQSNNTNSLMQGGGGEAGMLKHIKGTLLQFLKNCPVTDRNNEELLQIVFSMMEFSREEVTEVQNIRNTRKQHPSGSRALSVSSGGPGIGGTDPGEDEVRKKTSKGLFGMFKKSKGTGGKDETTSNNSMTQSPAKPLAPIKRH